jgi:enoyl-CoA hydratase/carnithine racemase
MSGQVRLDVDGAIAVITNDNPEKRNAFTDEMDAQLFEILGQLKEMKDVRAVIWRGEGHSWSSGRDVSAIGTNKTELTHHELMTRGHKGILQLFELEAPVIAAIQGWALGGSFQRALLCDIRIASEVARLYEMCGHGVVTDMVLTGRPMSAPEALALGVVSRVVPRDELDATAQEMAEKIAAAPAVTIKLARRVIKHLSEPAVRASMEDELIYQTFLNRSDDFAEFKAARAEERPPHYTGS